MQKTCPSKYLVPNPSLLNRKILFSSPRMGLLRILPSGSESAAGQCARTNLIPHLYSDIPTTPSTLLVFFGDHTAMPSFNPAIASEELQANLLRIAEWRKILLLKEVNALYGYIFTLRNQTHQAMHHAILTYSKNYARYLATISKRTSCILSRLLSNLEPMYTS